MVNAPIETASVDRKRRRRPLPKGSVRSAFTWLGICAALGGALWGLTLTKLHHDEAALKENALKQASSLSRAYAVQLSRSVEQIDQVTLHLKHYWREMNRALNLEKQMKDGLYPASAQLYVSIIDKHGMRVTSTIAGRLTGPSIAVRDSFQAHKRDPSKGLIISEPAVGLRSGKRLIRFSRRLDAADGTFDGVVVVLVEPSYLASFTDESSLGRNDFLAVRDAGGGLLATKAGEGIRSTPDVFLAPPHFEQQQGITTLPAARFTDAQPRIVSWQALKNYPLVSIVGIAEHDLYAAHQAMSRDYRNMAIAGSALLFLTAAVGMFLSFRLALKKQQAEEVKNIYRLATDGAREGFYMVRALYDQHNVPVDFVIHDCNERGAEFYGATKAELLGKRVSKLYSSEEYAREIIKTFSEVMETGYLEDEFKVSDRSSLKPTWIHRRLVNSGDGLAVTLRDISEMKAQEEALSHLANADAVTALPNRHWLMNYLPRAVELARSGSKGMALLFVDLDDFKNINDTLGHAAGDELLRAAASRLRTVIRPSDNVARLGGDEFTVILEGMDSTSDASLIAGRIIKSLSEPFMLADGSKHLVHASVGISMFPQDGDNGDALIKHADIAMYAAKSNGKGCFRFYQPHLSESLMIRLNMEQALRNAIEQDEFVLYYQPRVDTFSGELRGMEALVRWTHPERGMVLPQDFIPLAEETGLIVPLGEMVIRKACAQLALWKRQGLPVVPVSVNVSPRQFNHGNVSTLFASSMALHRLAPSLLEIEITESCMIGEDFAVTEELAAIEALGVKLLVDDFGTGYSSLSQLQRLDMDVLKVDRAFTSRLCNGKEGEAFFMAILSMAHVLGMSVVAEGVETVEQLRVLQALSCNEVQGYLISRPVPANEIPPLLRKRFLFPSLRPAIQPA